MNNKKILILFFSIVLTYNVYPTNQQPYKIFSSTQELIKIYQEPSLDKLVNQTINNYQNSNLTLPHNNPLLKIRTEQCQRAYIDTLLETVIHLQKNRQLNNQEIIIQAKQAANKAHFQIFFKKPQITFDAAQKGKIISAKYQKGYDFNTIFYASLL